MAPRAASAGELYSMPLNTDTWRKLTALLTLEEEGALSRACVAAWSAPTRGHPPATLLDDGESLERLFGRNFARVEPVIRQHFRPDPEHPGLLRCAWLAEVYATARAAYDQKVAAARKRWEGKVQAGKTPAPKRDRHRSRPDLFSGRPNAAAYPDAHAAAYPDAHATKTKLGVIHQERVTHAPAEQQQLVPIDLEAWAATREATIEAVISELCATVTPDELPRARRLYRRTAISIAFERERSAETPAEA